MAMLYPPYLDGKLPAQIGDTLRIPYQLNRAQGPKELEGSKILARIKNVSTNTMVKEIETFFLNNAENDIYYAFIDIKDISLRIGQYYKIQLAFQKDGYTGIYYSTVGVFKYTANPVVYIEGFAEDRINSSMEKFIGVYAQEKNINLNSPLGVHAAPPVKDTNDGSWKIKFNTENSSSVKGLCYNLNLEPGHYKISMDFWNQIRKNEFDAKNNVYNATPVLMIILNKDWGHPYKTFSWDELDASSNSYKTCECEFDIEETQLNAIVAIGFYSENKETVLNNNFAWIKNVNLQNYSKILDTSEKVEFYQFNIYKNDNLIESSGWQIHNFSQDSNFSRTLDEYSLKYQTEPDVYYSIEYQVQTNNGLKSSSPKYSFKRQYKLPLNLQSKFKINMFANIENGSIDLEIESIEDQTQLKGKFLLLRKQESTEWYTMQTLYIDHNYMAQEKQFIFSDNTVEHGVTYSYALQQISVDEQNNEKLSTELLHIGTMTAYFDDLFLLDGERQLKIKFNPQVSSFKNTILENKTDTLGGQFPIFSRNGRVSYKDFPISGLISYHMDDNNSFLSNTNIIESSINLTHQNFKIERDFKMEVLNWLNNGLPKIFKSPSEGNYIVRLMNVSLSPEQALGRMLHTFNCNAYEIDNYSYDSLYALNLLGQTKKILTNIYYNSINLTEINNSFSLPKGLNKVEIHAPIGTKFQLRYLNDVINIAIGQTEYYEVYIDKNYELQNIKLISNISDGVNISYWYTQNSSYLIKTEMGEEIINYLTEDRIEQWGGPKEILFNNNNLLLSNINYLRINKKSIQQVYNNNNKYYYNRDIVNQNFEYRNELTPENMLKTSIYHDDVFDNYIYLKDGKIETCPAEDLSFQIVLDNEILILSENEQFIEFNKYDFDNQFLLKQITLSNGVYVDIYYCIGQFLTRQ